VISGRKTATSDFCRPLLKSTLSLRELCRETNGSLMV